jgi:hypothetical protein
MSRDAESLSLRRKAIALSLLGLAMLCFAAYRLQYVVCCGTIYDTRSGMGAWRTSSDGISYYWPVFAHSAIAIASLVVVALSMWMLFRPKNNRI